MAGTFTGTIAYMSPQMLGGAVYNNKTDVWSTGIVFIEMMTFKTPTIVLVDFKKLNPKNVPLSNENDTRMVALRQCICSNMIVGNEEERATVGEIIASPEFRKQFDLVSTKAKEWLHGDEKATSGVATSLKNDENTGTRIAAHLLAKLQLSARQVDMNGQVDFHFFK